MVGAIFFDFHICPLSSFSPSPLIASLCLLSFFLLTFKNLKFHFNRFVGNADMKGLFPRHTACSRSRARPSTAPSALSFGPPSNPTRDGRSPARKVPYSHLSEYYFLNFLVLRPFTFLSLRLVGIEVMTGEIVFSLRTWLASALSLILQCSLSLNLIRFSTPMRNSSRTRASKGFIPAASHPSRAPGAPSTVGQKTWNRAINSVRVDVERSIRVIKRFDCLRVEWNHSLHLHPLAFHVCANFANISLRSSPINKFVNTWLS